MSLYDDTTQRDPLDLLAEEFLKRHRQGPVDVEAFALEHPAHAEGLRELLPTLIALEDCKRDRASSGSGRGRVSLPALTQLGDFRIVGELGRGGMGVVFDAVQESLGRRVALKVLPQASLLQGNQLERFRREAHIAAQLHHSNIVPVFGSGESEGYHWYAMQFIAGESLERWRQLQAEAPPRGTGAWRNRARFCARIGIQAASALHYAHGQGTLHRDIKPANLLLEANEHVWVTDFGLAKALEAEGLTYAGDLLGTLQYMAPEQFEGNYDVRSEVYALGVTLYEVLVLRPAFAGKTRSELMERIRTQRPEALRRLCPEVPEDLVVVVEKAMAREPRDRYQDAHEFEQDLQAFLEDRPIQARRHSAPALVLRWCRRNRAMAALAASTVFAVVGAGVYGWIAYGTAAAQQARAEHNLRHTLGAFSNIFDALIGPDPALAFDEDEETGEQTVVVRAIEPSDVAVLQQMITFYDQFASQNAGNQALQLETARACRRVGQIHARLGRPEDLEEAAKAYQQALDRLAKIENRDVRRETAAVQIEFGKLERQRGRGFDATPRFAQALALLESVASDGGKEMRLERAEVHFFLAEPSGGPPGGRGGPPRERLARSREDGERPRPPREQEQREQLKKAMDLVDSLLDDGAEHNDARALKARCLLRSARIAPRDEERDAAEAAAIAILRELVTQYPERSDDRFELCRALLPPPRRDDPRQGRESEPADLAVLREAKMHAERLLAEQPLFREYQRLRARASSLLGRALAGSFAELAESARPARRAEAETELRSALRHEGDLLGVGREVEMRTLEQVLKTRLALVFLCETSGQRDDAIAEFKAVLDLVEKQLADRPRPGPPDASWRPQLRSQATRLGDAMLTERLHAILQRVPSREDLPPPEGGPRPDRRGEGRRQGR
ncbi:MAG TPA: serine/threonine-protein kinase [Planctomycetota bacterium]|nr:serine/threonine-protein kinase [Planctomycetota bacterium]